MSQQKVGRPELVAALVEQHGLPKSKANEILTTLVDEIQNQVAKRQQRDHHRLRDIRRSRARSSYWTQSQNWRGTANCSQRYAWL